MVYSKDKVELIKDLIKAFEVDPTQESAGNLVSLFQEVSKPPYAKNLGVQSIREIQHLLVSTHSKLSADISKDGMYREVIEMFFKTFPEAKNQPHFTPRLSTPKGDEVIGLSTDIGISGIEFLRGLSRGTNCYRALGNTSKSDVWKPWGK